MEIWKDVIGYEGLYQVSNEGRIKSLERYVRSDVSKTGQRLIHERVLKNQLNTNGYPIAHLSKNNFAKSFTIHSLLAKAFLPNADNKRCVNHKNGIKTDNRVENLEWVTDSENCIHALAHELTKGRKVIDTASGCIYKTIVDAATYHSLNKTTLRDYLIGKRANKTSLQFLSA